MRRFVFLYVSSCLHRFPTSDPMRKNDVCRKSRSRHKYHPQKLRRRLSLTHVGGSARRTKSLRSFDSANANRQNRADFRFKTSRRRDVLHVTAQPNNFGWVQSDAVVGQKRGDDARLAKLVQALDGFEQIECAMLFLETFPDSALRPQILLLLGDVLGRNRL